MPRKISILKALSKLLDTAPQPMYVLDGERRFIYGNAAFSAWIGRKAEDLAGLKCVYSASGELSGAAELAGAIAAPPEAFSLPVWEGQIVAPGERAQQLSRPARFVQLPGVDKEPAGVLVVVGERDIRFHAGAAFLGRAVPGSTVRHIAGAGHHPQRRHAEVVAGAITAHVSVSDDLEDHL